MRLKRHFAKMQRAWYGRHEYGTPCVSVAFGLPYVEDAFPLNPTSTSTTSTIATHLAFLIVLDLLFIMFDLEA